MKCTISEYCVACPYALTMGWQYLKDFLCFIRLTEMCFLCHSNVELNSPEYWLGKAFFSTASIRTLQVVGVLKIWKNCPLSDPMNK